VPLGRDVQQSSATPGQTWQQARHHAMTRSGELDSAWRPAGGTVARAAFLDADLWDATSPAWAVSCSDAPGMSS
jgi:hypothetical protein